MERVSSTPEDEGVRAAKDLAARAGRGEPDAQRALVLRLMAHVRRTVRSLLGGDAEADDALQIAMIEVLASVTSYRGDASLERWSGRIAARTSLRLLRERRTRTGRIDAERETSEIAQPAPLDAARLAPGAILDHLEALPEERRTCLVLRHVHGYSVEEIAAMTGVSPNTVKDRLVQGRARLRQLVRRAEVIDSVAVPPERLSTR